MLHIITSMDVDSYDFYRQMMFIEQLKDDSTIHSINSIVEISLFNRFKNVKFHPTDQTSYFVNKTQSPSMKPFIKLSSKLHGTVCFIKSDLFIPKDSFFWKIVSDVRDGEVWFGSKTNVDSIETLSGQESNPYGFDYFIFKADERNNDLLFGSSTFYFGEPFWDFWFILSALQNKRRCFKVNKSCVFHERHHGLWDQNAWNMYGNALFNFFFHKKEGLYSDIEKNISVFQMDIKNYIESNVYNII